MSIKSVLAKLKSKSYIPPGWSFSRWKSAKQQTPQNRFSGSLHERNERYYSQISVQQQQVTGRRHFHNRSGISALERSEILETSTMDAVSKGWRIESKGQFYAVVVEGRSVNHILHLLLTILTSGLWIIVWLLLVVSGGERRRMIYVNEFGYVSFTKA